MAESVENDSDSISLYQVLEEEYEALHGPLPPAYDKGEQDPEKRLAAIVALMHKQERSALCISGGGIRSATFGLGILQGLARCGLIAKFDYLSTVSGGGYIGSWLTAWIERHDKGLSGVKEDLENARPESKTSPEPAAIRHLRSYSNYLSPKLGLLSADTWALIGTIFRNLVLIWLVLVPLIAAVLMIPRISVAFVNWKLIPSHPSAIWACFGIGTFFAVWAIVYMGLHRPSTTKSRAGQGRFLALCFLPLFLSAVSLTSFWAWHRVNNQSEIGIEWFLLYGVSLNLASWIIYTAMLHFKTKGESWRGLGAQLADLFNILVTGAAGGCLTWVAATKLFDKPTSMSEIYACLATPVYLFTFLLAATFFIGISSRWTDDEDREWWARAGAWVLISILVWVVFSILVIFGPPVLSLVWAAIGGASGLITILLGRSPKTDAKKNKEDEKKNKPSQLLMNLALALAAPVFVAFLIILLSAGTSWLLGWLSEQDALLSLIGQSSQTLNSHFNEGSLQFPWLMTNGPFGHLKIVYYSPVWFVSIITGAVALLGVIMAFLINTNKFSLHAMYRNRLIRAYLGASNTSRNPNLFTGFDENDNLQMCEIWPSVTPEEPLKQRKKLLHVVNMALNLVGGENLAWQQRKAQSFTVSPLHAGSCQLNPGYRRSGNGPNGKPSKYYGGKEGISLGTAVTISGAAASPNMGYHSSPALTFLMTLFNARLGWWLGNPGPKGEKTFDRSYPKFAVGPIIEEALGLTSADRPYVYLSDGGHFENLGLYEMVLRRCRFIVVSDASQDGECKFQDLGGAVRKIRTDFGIPIEFNDEICIFSRSDDKEQNKKGRYCAIGTIRYSCVDKVDGKDAPDGVLIYIKPAFYGNEPRDVYEYAMSNKQFPHETTGDQYFSESQFESYRMLGSHIMEKICGPGFKASGFDDLKRKCEEHLAAHKPQPQQE